MRRFAGPLLGLAVLVTAWTVTSGLPPMDTQSDAAADWIFTRAAWSGFDPWRPLDEVASDLGIEIRNLGWPTKPPAVIAVYTPLLGVPLPAIPWLFLALNIAAVGAVVALSARLAGWRIRWWIWPLLALTIQVREALWWSNPIPIWAALILSTWWLTSRADSSWSGVPLGVAAGVRLWPLLLVFPLWNQGRRRSALAVGGVALGMNLAPLLLPAATLDRAVGGMFRAGAAWHDWWYNASLGRLLGGGSAILISVVAASVVVGWWLSNRSGSFGAVTVLGILASPISWVTYYLTALPVVLRDWPVTVIPAVLIASGVWQLTVVGGLWLLWLTARSLPWEGEGRLPDPGTNRTHPRRSAGPPALQDM